MKKSAPNMSLSRSGVGLVEMICVVSIMAIMAAIAIPRYASSVSHYRASAAASRVVADLKLAQANARATSLAQVVTFSPSTSTYQVVGIAGLNQQANSYIVNLAADPYDASISSATFGNLPQVTFDNFGMPNSPGTVVLVIGTTTKTITLDLAGQLTVQ